MPTTAQNTSGYMPIAQTTSGYIVKNNTNYQRLYSQQQHKIPAVTYQEQHNLQAVILSTTAQTTRGLLTTTPKNSSGYMPTTAQSSSGYIVIKSTKYQRFTCQKQHEISEVSWPQH